jgi:rSAM/selenodomain-associated transferase 1
VSHAKQCAFGVMAKVPQPGRSKTRLMPVVSAEAAASLGAAFLRDVTENLRLAASTAPIASYVAYAPAGLEPLFDGHLAPGTRLVLADGSPPMPPRVAGFGRCLLHAVQALLDAGHGAACVLNADSPTLPTVVLCEAANTLLAGGERVVLGAVDDGGYYLLGMTAPHAHLFEDIAWSTDTVAEATRDRARTLGLELIELPTWYDIDEPPSLHRLLDEIAAPSMDASLPPYAAPVTRACIARLGLRAGNKALAAE